MAMKSVVLLLTLCFTFLISHGLAQNSPSISPRHSNSVEEFMLECWSSLFDLGWCYGDLLRAAQSGKADLSIQPTCCKAARSMNSGCWPKMFPYNPFFPQVFQTYCLRFPSAPPPPSDASTITPDLQEPAMASPTPVNAEASTPNAEGPSMVSPAPVKADEPPPDAEGPALLAPFALPPYPYAPSPTIEGPIMDTPRGEGPLEQPWFHF